MHIPTLDWDFTVPQELYGLDPREGDLTHSMQGAPVIVARGALTAGPEGLDERGTSLSAQALSLIRAPLSTARCTTGTTSSAVRPSPPPKGHQGDTLRAPTCRASSELRLDRMKTS